MRYYYYGDKRSPEEKTAGNGRAGTVKAGSINRRMSGRDQDLVIEEDTVYEIDRECIRCQRKSGNKKSC